MARLAGEAIAAEAPGLPRVLGGISPIDPDFMGLIAGQGVMDAVDAVAVHGFPLDWNHWLIDEWPAKIDSIRGVTHLPVWVSEVGVSSFGAEEVQQWGLRRTAELLSGRTPRIQWYSLYDLPAAWPATTRHREAEGSSYYRHFHMGLLRRERPSEARCENFAEFTPEFGLCQWFHFEDHRLDDAVRWMRDLGVTYLRTGLSWADWYRPDARGVVRPADASAGTFRHHGHVLLHARGSGHLAALHRASEGAGGVRRVLRAHDPPLRAGRRTGSALAPTAAAG